MSHNHRGRPSRVRSLRLALAGVAATLLVLAGRPAAADLKLGDDSTFVRVGLLIQAWATATENGAPDGESWGKELYLRRARLVLNGQATPRLAFFIMTDNPNLGRRGDLATRTYVQDAWLEANLGAGLQLDVGMFMVPFTHNGAQGATTMPVLDHHVFLLGHPPGSTIGLRDFGIMLRGLPLGPRVEFRAAVLNGVRGGLAADPAGVERNPNDWPRVTSRVQVHLLDPEGGPGPGGLYYKGVNLVNTPAGLISPKRVVTLGASVDWQSDLNVNVDTAGAVTGREDYLGVAGDLYVDLPVACGGLVGFTGQVAFVAYDQGGASTRYAGDAATRLPAQYTGYGLYGEAGLRFGAYQGFATLDWYNDTGSGTDAGDFVAATGGFNWWWLGHTSNLKLQVGESRRGDGDWNLEGVLQAQVSL